MLLQVCCKAACALVGTYHFFSAWLYLCARPIVLTVNPFYDDSKSADVQALVYMFMLFKGLSTVTAKPFVVCFELESLDSDF